MLPSTSKENGRKKKRLTRRLSWDDDGVASTIGTIMALMIFLTFLSMFMNQYVPIWMEDNEATHMNNVEGQFANLKQSIDIQILAGMMGEYDLTLYTPITLGAQGIPMFAAPTMGQLSTNPDPSNSSASIAFMYNVSGSGPTLLEKSGNGNIKLIVPNRYFVPQTIVYENDAIILTQSDGELIKAPPQLNLRKEGTRYNMVFTLISIVSNNQTYNGFDNRGVTTYLRSAVSTTYEDFDPFLNVTDALTGDIYVNQTTQYGDAWFSYMNNTMQRYGFTYGVEYDLTRTTLWVNALMEPTERISLRIGSSIISKLTVNHAHFDVVIGESGVSG